MDAINLFVLFSSAFSWIFGLVIYSRNRTRQENKAFLWFALSVGLWALSLGALRAGIFLDLVTLARILYVSAALIGLAFLYFTLTYEARETPSKRAMLFAGLITAAVTYLTVMPGMLILDVFPRAGLEPFIVLNPLPHLLYALYICGSGVLGLGILAQRAYVNFRGARNKYLYIMVATAVPLTAGVVTNLLLPALGIFELNWIGQASTFAMVVILAYGMHRQQIFDSRVIATELLVFILCAVSLTRVVLSVTMAEILFNMVAFLIVLGVSILLARSVYREVMAKEQIEKLAGSLAKANERLRELDRQKSEFLSIASHQLRTPLASIRGYASLLLEGSYGALEEKVAAPLRTIFASSGRMAETVEDFLNVSRIEQGRMDYRFQKMDVAKLTEQVVSELTIAAQNKKLELSFRAESGPFPVVMDPTKIQHVISNIIDNAIKYTPRGSIDVTVKKHECRNDVCVVVSDTGAGIPKEALHTIFDKFVRARNANVVNVTGTGLGMYVAREMLKVHHGTISAASEGEGKGSTFTVCLPLSNDEGGSKDTQAYARVSP